MHSICCLSLELPARGGLELVLNLQHPLHGRVRHRLGIRGLVDWADRFARQAAISLPILQDTFGPRNMEQGRLPSAHVLLTTFTW